MKLSLITAIAANNVIGDSKSTTNGLPWHLPDELQNFREITKNTPVIMGRKTHECIKGLLPGRQNIIVSRNPHYTVVGATVCHSLEQAIASIIGDEAFIIGGGEVYQHALNTNTIDSLYITSIHSDAVGDVYFPELDLTQWQKISSTFHPQDDTHACSFTMEVYERLSA